MAKRCFLICLLLVLATTVGPSAQLPTQQAGSTLNPLAYDSLGVFPAAPGAYQFNTSGVPTLLGPGVRIEGIVVDHVAVFTFDDIWVPDGIILSCVGSRPLALLSQHNLTVDGLISAGTCGETRLGSGAEGGGGGGFGGAGGPSWFIEEGLGGAAHGDILITLHGGSGGGVGTNVEGRPYLGGGLGGGALQLGAVGTIAIRGGGVLADGGHGAWFPPPEICPAEDSYGGGGGGSGGAILLHANSVVLETRLGASGGNGGWGCGGGPGGGGGGGRIAVSVGSGGFLNAGTIVVAGGFPGGQVGQIVVRQREDVPPVAFTVEAHTFAAGGQGCWQGPFYCGGAYYDETPGNWGDAQVRPGTDVDLWYDDGGIVIGGLDGLEWLAFPVTVPQSGHYLVTFRTASPADRPLGSGVVNVGAYGIDGSWIGNQTVPVTGGAGDWHTYITWQAPTTIYLPAGAQTLTMWAAGGWYNVRSMRFILATPSETTGPRQ